MSKFLPIVYQQAFNGSFLNVIKFRYHFLGKAVFALKEHPGKTEIFLKGIDGIAVVQYILPLDI